MSMDWFVFAYRLFCAALLCFFAFAPLYVGGYVVLAVAQNPSELNLFAVAVVSICAAIAYFLLLLAYRAATGRGRKSDGGLLPPLVMKGLFLLFGVIAVAIVGVGLWQGELRPIFGGIAYLVVAFAAWRATRSRSNEA